jgi:cytochrome c oxidase subunit 1
MAAVEVRETPQTPEIERRTYLNSEHTVSSWLLTVDHKRIGVMYLIAVTTFS